MRLKLGFMPRTLLLLVALMIAGAWLSAPLFADTAPAAQAEDPSGVKTGTAADIGATDKSTILDLANAIGHNRVAINIMWTLITGFLVMFMQAGFAMVETGLTRAKNVAHTMAMNFMIYPLGMLGFWVMGYALMFGGTGAIGTMGGFNGLNRFAAVVMQAAAAEMKAVGDLSSAKAASM